MGLHPQGVQRIVNELAKEGLVEFRANPAYRARIPALYPEREYAPWRNFWRFPLVAPSCLSAMSAFTVNIGGGADSPRTP